MKSCIIWSVFALMIVFFTISCSPKNCQIIDQTIIDNISAYENAHEVIKNNITTLSNFKGDNMIIIGKKEITEMLSLNNREEFKDLIELWNNRLLLDENSIQLNIKNESVVIFQVKRCKNYIHEIIYDPLHIYGIGIADDVIGIKEEWINKNWKYYIIRYY